MTIEHIDSVRKSIIALGYKLVEEQFKEFASYGPEESWILLDDGRVNPKNFNYEGQVWQWTFDNEQDSIEFDPKCFPDGFDNLKFLYDEIISWDELVKLLYEGVDNFLEKHYGANWIETCPDIIESIE